MMTNIPTIRSRALLHRLTSVHAVDVTKNEQTSRKKKTSLENVTRSDQMDLKVLESLKLKFLMHGLLVCTSLWMIIMNDHSFSPPLLVCALANVHFQQLVQS